MKYYPNNIDLVISKIKSGEVRSVLLFGPDQGMVSEFCKRIGKELKSEITNFELKQGSDLLSALNNLSLFAKREIIKLEIKSIKLDDDLKNTLLNKNLNFPLLFAHELDSSNQIRKLYEGENNLAVIACYPDDERSIRQIIVSKFRAENKQIASEALDYLVMNLSGDRMLVLNELDKLLLYCLESPKIELEDCVNSISSNLLSNPDLLCIAFAEKNGKNYLKELDQLIENAVSEVWIIRALARYYLNLLSVKLYEQGGIAIANGVKLLRPPIFFKYSQKFTEIASKLSLKEINLAIENLTKAEIDLKEAKDKSAIDNLFMEHFGKK